MLKIVDAGGVVLFSLLSMYHKSQCLSFELINDIINAGSLVLVY